MSLSQALNQFAQNLGRYPYKLIREYILLLGSRIGVYFVGVIYRCIGINTKLGIIHTII